MGDIFEEVKDSRTALEKLLDIIPGWGGYQERQNRRKADQVLRQTLAESLESCARRWPRVWLASAGSSTRRRRT